MLAMTNFFNNAHGLEIKVSTYFFKPCNVCKVGVDRLSAWPIIGADIKHFTDYRYRPL